MEGQAPWTPLTKTPCSSVMAIVAVLGNQVGYLCWGESGIDTSANPEPPRVEILNGHNSQVIETKRELQCWAMQSGSTWAGQTDND